MTEKWKTGKGKKGQKIRVKKTNGRHGETSEDEDVNKKNGGERKVAGRLKSDLTNYTRILRKRFTDNLILLFIYLTIVWNLQSYLRKEATKETEVKNVEREEIL